MIQSVHLSGNGVTGDLRMKIKGILKAQEYDTKKNRMQHVQTKNQEDDDEDVEEMNKAEQLIQSFNKRALKDSFLAKKTNLNYESGMDPKYILWRILGHKELCGEEMNLEYKDQRKSKNKELNTSGG